MVISREWCIANQAQNFCKLADTILLCVWKENAFFESGVRVLLTVPLTRHHSSYWDCIKGWAKWQKMSHNKTTKNDDELSCSLQKPQWWVYSHEIPQDRAGRKQQLTLHYSMQNVVPCSDLHFNYSCKLPQKSILDTNLTSSWVLSQVTQAHTPDWQEQSKCIKWYWQLVYMAYPSVNTIATSIRWQDANHWPIKAFTLKWLPLHIIITQIRVSANAEMKLAKEIALSVLLFATLATVSESQ